MSSLSPFVSIDELRFLSQSVAHMSYATVSHQRMELFRLIDGDAFYPLRKWKKLFIRMFWDKPMTDRSTFQLFLFLVCNGCSPQLAANWIMYSQFWNKKALKKRFCQLKYIVENFDVNKNKWFYFDIRNNVHRFVSGELRRIHRH